MGGAQVGFRPRRNFGGPYFLHGEVRLYDNPHISIISLVSIAYLYDMTPTRIAPTLLRNMGGFAKGILLVHPQHMTIEWIIICLVLLCFFCFCSGSIPTPTPPSNRRCAEQPPVSSDPRVSGETGHSHGGGDQRFLQMLTMTRVLHGASGDMHEPSCETPILGSRGADGDRIRGYVEDSWHPQKCKRKGVKHTELSGVADYGRAVDFSVVAGA